MGHFVSANKDHVRYHYDNIIERLKGEGQHARPPSFNQGKTEAVYEFVREYNPGAAAHIQETWTPDCHRNAFQLAFLPNNTSDKDSAWAELLSASQRWLGAEIGHEVSRHTKVLDKKYRVSRVYRREETIHWEANYSKVINYEDIEYHKDSVVSVKFINVEMGVVAGQVRVKIQKRESSRHIAVSNMMCQGIFNETGFNAYSLTKKKVKDLEQRPNWDIIYIRGADKKDVFDHIGYAAKRDDSENYEPLDTSDPRYLDLDSSINIERGYQVTITHPCGWVERALVYFDLEQHLVSFKRKTSLHARKQIFDALWALGPS